MLVLSRTLGEEIVIGKNREIVIQVTKVKGSYVNLGISAERAIPVVRGEILHKPPKAKRTKIPEKLTPEQWRLCQTLFATGDLLAAELLQENSEHPLATQWDKLSQRLRELMEL